jgi:hypothetical protein
MKTYSHAPDADGVIEKIQRTAPKGRRTRGPDAASPLN